MSGNTQKKSKKKIILTIISSCLIAFFAAAILYFQIPPLVKNILTVRAEVSVKVSVPKTSFSAPIFQKAKPAPQNNKAPIEESQTLSTIFTLSLPAGAAAGLPLAALIVFLLVLLWQYHKIFCLKKQNMEISEENFKLKKLWFL